MKRGQGGAAPTGPPRRRSGDIGDPPASAPKERDSCRLGITDRGKTIAFCRRFAVREVVVERKTEARLLVSVRSAAEVEPALAGGAALIDVKEPDRGSLGRADDSTIAAVVRAVDHRAPVSAAFGELAEKNAIHDGLELAFAKWGLAGCAGGDWQSELVTAARQLSETHPKCAPVAVAYADWRRADAPTPAAILAFAREFRFAALLVDTWRKDGTTLLDWMDRAFICRFCDRCRNAGLRVGLAGSLGAPEMEMLLDARPNWFAVRGAVCRGGRGGRIDPRKVRRLALLLSAGAIASIP